MRARFDQLVKGIFREALTPAGTVRNQEEVAAEAQAIDTLFEPDPARAHALDDLGYLGKMARVPCLFEAYHNTVDVPELRSCVRKQLTLDHLESNKARRKQLCVPRFPHLWVISSGRPELIIGGYGYTPILDWPSGFFQRCELDAIGLVVLRELPRARDTLLLRLMGSGAVLKQAIVELLGLPDGAREREVAMTSLVAFRARVTQDPTEEEREFLMSTEPLYDQWEKQVKNQGRAEGRMEGRMEGLAEGQRGMLLEQLHARFGVVPPSAALRIKAADVAELSRWAKRVLSAPTLEDVLGDP
jgi:hypothetical protein